MKTISILFVLLPCFLFSQDYRTLIEEGKIKEGVQSYFNVANIEDIHIYGSYDSIKFTNRKDLENIAKRGNIAALFLLSEFTYITELDLALGNYEDSSLYIQNMQAYYYYNIVSYFSSEEKELKSLISLAHYRLGEIYSNNQINIENIDLAIQHYKYASIHTDLKGQCYLLLGFLYKKSNNSIQSINYYEKAFLLGKSDYETAESISWAYKEGEYGLKKNIIKSYVWKIRSEKLKNKLAN